MKTKHAPGPWVALYSSNKYPSIHSGPTNTPVAVLYEYVSETDRDLLDNAEANAKLIAAAPEMLEALELCLTKLPNSSNSEAYKVYFKILKALDKAKELG